MTITRPLSNLALAMMTLPVILGAWLCYVRPEKAALWAVGMFTLPVLWLVTRAVAKAFGRDMACAAATHPEALSDAGKIISGTMIFAGFLISASLGTRLAAALDLIGDPSADALAARITGVLIGCFLIFYGNRLPKTLWPLSSRCDPAKTQFLQRAAGWSYVLTGLAFTLVWLAVPLDLARLLGMAVVVVGVLVPSVIIMIFYVKRRAQPLNR